MALLEQKPFESIQVNELCQACMIPKSTFYNYFDDKYDLLNYLFQRWEEQIYPEVSQIGPRPSAPRKSCAGCWTLWSSIRTC